MLWRRFIVIMSTSLAALTLFCFSFVVLVDPYHSLSFSLDFERVQVDGTQRLFYPALARNSRFNSAVIGTSNVRLIKPEILNNVLGGRWLNLGLNAASAWEQEKIYDVFIDNRQQIKNILVGVDYIWCYDQFAEQRFVGANTEADFPAWLYDKSTANNIPPLNLGSLKHSFLQALTALGLRENKYGEDGYTVFTEPQTEYSLRKARKNIYGSEQPKPVLPVTPAVKLSPAERADLPISALARLESMFNKLPESTRKIFFFVPYHSYFQARPGSRQMIIWEECKRRITDIAAPLNNAYVLDFMIRSVITSEDRNYWDHKHYSMAIGEQLSHLIGTAINQGQVSSNYKILYPLGGEDH